jgi:glycosyltransferase involved in cell wall biosynthesis
MFSSYMAPAADHPTAAVVSSQPAARTQGFRDALSKLQVEDLALVDAGGRVAEIQTNDEAATGDEEPLATIVHEWPRISVVTVSYNQAKYLPECITSVLGQGYPYLDFVVVDGGSTDGSREILESHAQEFSSLVIEPDRGQSHALNKGFALASGEVVTWLCSDDRLEPGALGAVAEVLARTSCDIVAGGCRVIDEEGRTKTVHHSAFVTETVSPLSFGDLASFTATWHKALYFYQPEVFFTNDLWQRSGAHVKEHLHYAMDYDLFLRFALAGADVFATRRILGCSRQHSGQKTRHETPLYLPTVERILRDFRNDLARLDPGLTS